MSRFEGADFTDGDTVTEAEGAITKLKELTDKANEECGAAADLKEKARPVEGEKGALADLKKEYYPVTYWVKGKDTFRKRALHKAVPSTCKGTPIGQPLINQNIPQCAKACDESTTAGD